MAKASVAERPKAVEALVGTTIAFRFAERAPSLSDVVRVVGTASRLLRYDNVDELSKLRMRLYWHWRRNGNWSANWRDWLLN